MNTNNIVDGRPIFQPKKLKDQDIRFLPSPLNCEGMGVSLGEILAQAYKDDMSMMMPLPPVEKRQWSHSHHTGMINWKHWLFGSLQVEIVNMNVDEPQQQGSNSFVRVRPLSKLQHPSWVTLRFSASVGKNRDADVRLLDIRGSEATDVTEKAIEPLSVNIEWKAPEDRNQPMIPHTRAKDKDNLDFIFLASDGKFVQIQVSLVSRAGRIWVCIQELYSGQVVRTTQVKARELRLTNHSVSSHAALVAPLYVENAFPGSDYLKSFVSTGQRLVEYALGRNAVVAFSDCSVAKWAAEESLILPDKMRENGWQKATVAFFNLVVGFGNVLCKDGKPCFVHFSRIIDETGRQVASQGDFPALVPMKEVAIKYREEGGRRQATAIRVL